MNAGSPSVFSPVELLRAVRNDLVGMTDEAEVLAVALATGRHVVLEGPPGTGKSTLLRSLANAAGVPLFFVEGNAELTPGRLVGYHDPALVLQAGYRPDAFVAGPLTEAVQSGGLLYLEELNRIPEESLNVLITALAEGELHVPRVGRIAAHPNFRLIAAMNPFDAIGTARIGQAVYDRLCRVAIGYQEEDHERAITAQVTALTSDDIDVEIAVALSRATRTSGNIRVGSSVRGAIDMALLAQGLRSLRGDRASAALRAMLAQADGSGKASDEDAAMNRQVFLDAALAAFSGRIRLDEGCDSTPETVVTELLDAILNQRFPQPLTPSEDDPGKGKSPGAPLPQEQNRGRILEGDEARKAVQEAARRTSGRQELQRKHQRFDEASPNVGQLDQEVIDELIDEDPDVAAELLADLASATDENLRALARKAASRLFIQVSKRGAVRRKGVRRLIHERGGSEGDLDLDATLAINDGMLPNDERGIVRTRWGSADKSVCLLIDRSGSMTGKSVARAAVASASVLISVGERDECSVVAFAKDAVVLQDQNVLKRRRPEAVISDILSLRGKGVTDLALALRAARGQLARASASDRCVVLLSDALTTEGGDPLTALRGIDRLHVIGTSAEPESVAAGTLLARRGGGRYVCCTSVADIPKAVMYVLNASDVD